MSNLFFLVATNFLALVSFTSALAKTIQEPDPFRSHQHWVLAISNTRWFSVLELGIGAILLFPLPMLVQAGAAITLGIVIIDGQFEHAKHPEAESEAFGSLTPDSQALYFAIGAAVIAATAFVVFKAMQTPFAQMPINWWSTGVTLAILIITERKLRYDQSRGQGYAKKNIDIAAVSKLPPDLCIGRNALGPLTTRELVATGKPSMIVGISPHSSQCRDTYALLTCHATLLSKELTIVVIAENDELYRRTPNAPLRQLLDPCSHLSRFLGLRARPYALLVDRDLTLLAPPSQTSQKVQRLITLLVTTIQNAPETFLTLGQADQQQR
jgi:hypothetical protein